MANTLTNLIPDLYESLDVVSREMVGIIPATTMSMTAERAALNETIRSFETPANTAGQDIAAAANPPDTGDQTIANKDFTISKSRSFPFRWNGEEQKGVNNGPGYQPIRAAQMQQAMRACINEVEADLAALHIHASRAYGTAGTTPFASNLADTAQVGKMLTDNGAPKFDRHLAMDTAAGANVRTLQNLTKANEAGTTSILNQGELIDIHGFKMRESAQINTSTAGTASGATTDATGYAVGATVITLASAGTGTIIAGDAITFAGDTNKYVIESGDADVSNGGTITLAAPGLRVAIAASATAITVVAAAARNMAFTRNAIALATRIPAVPEEGDMAVDSMIITDPRSGLSFEIRMYLQYRRVYFELCLAWGVKMIKPEHCVLLLG